MTNFSNRSSVLDKTVLNSVQRDAVLYDDGPQLVFAGAGTGKTRVLTAKIAFLIEKGYHPGQIFAATFTNKAAREMKLRVENLTGIPADGLWIGTFHSLCARILRRESSHIGYMPSFTIYDSDDQLSLIKKILKSFDIDDRSMPPRQILSIISGHKNACTPPETLEEVVKGYFDQELLRIYKAYQKSLFDQQAMDFDDLLANTVYLFRKCPQVLGRYENLFKYVLVDEYQDTNTAQFLFLKFLSANHGRIFAVGDDDQSIYGWRGAKIENILSFERQFPDTKIFKLEQNYRSTKAILDFANAAIIGNQNRTSKMLWTDRPSGETVIVKRFRDDRQEADNVADRIGQLTGKYRGNDMAILFRTNAQSRTFEDALRKRKIPYVLVGGTSFYERAEIKDCLAYLKLLVNPKDNLSFERIYNVPARGLGDKARDVLAGVAAQRQSSMLETLFSVDTNGLGSRYIKGFSDLKEIFELLVDLDKQKESPAEIIKQVLQLSGYVDMLTAEESEEASGRLENINELVNALTLWSNENPDKKLSDFLEEVTLATDVDRSEFKDNAVSLMTLHCAKGLEFKIVFLVGLEDGIIPSRQNFDDEAKIEEERRLLYVGITRSMEILECSHVDQRWRFGDLLPSTPSRFLEAIPANLYTFKDNSSFFGTFPELKKSPVLNGRTFVKPAASKPVSQEFREPQYDDFSQETKEYRIGQYIKHKTYGRGRILSVSGFGEDMKITVLFNDGARRKLMAKFANFES